MRLPFLLFAVPAWLAAAPVSYLREVRPILGRSCQPCHQQSNRSGGVSVAAYRDLVAAVKAGKPDESLLLRQISGERPRMPKAGAPLSATEVALIRRWIEEGAKDDSPAGGGSDTWWSLKPLGAAPGAPSIDGFIRAKLSANGLAPSPEADRRTLIRRLTFDLHGLPPTPEEIAAFVADKSPKAYEDLVDRLLASPRYGERWARHWLDVVHYGETHGYDKDKVRANAWPYRDYVIAAFNSDKPYARFAEEQLAGDVLFPDDPNAVVATGFIAAGPWDFVGHQELREGTTDKNITRVLDRDDMVAAAMSTFTSMTAHCARCHDHKFDPIKQEDYYSLQAVFAGVDRADRPYDSDPAVHRQRQQLLRRKRDVFVELQPLLDKVDFATSPEIVALDDRIQDANLQLAHIGEPRNDADAALRKQFQSRVAEDRKRRKELVDSIAGRETYSAMDRLKAAAAALDEEIAKLPEPLMVYAATDFFTTAGRFRPALMPRPVHLLARGNVQAPGKPMVAGALSCLTGLRSRWEETGDSESARRSALARWITDSRNVLAWRSIVNRVWHYHFGAGIVDTPNDFGRMGSQPSHPELLDWLAVWFRDDAHGSLKALHKLIVTSAVYRQGSKPRADAVRIDAENRLLWRMNRIRLDAESVRDSVLAAAGKLDLTMGGPPVRMFFFKDDHSPVYDYARFDVDAPGAYRRSIYRFLVRSVPDPFMERLDCPDPSILSPKRTTTLTAIQALALMNNPFMVRMAEHLASRVRAAEPEGGRRVSLAVKLLFGREPSPQESGEFGAYASRHGLENLCRLLFNTNEFLFAD